MRPGLPSQTPQSQTPASVQLGFGCFAIGLVFVVITVVPFFLGDHNRSLWLNLGCLLAPLGFIMTVTGTVRAGRAGQRAALAELAHRYGEDAPGSG